MLESLGRTHPPVGIDGEQTADEVFCWLGDVSPIPDTRHKVKWSEPRGGKSGDDGGVAAKVVMTGAWRPKRWWGRGGTGGDEEVAWRHGR